MLFDAGVIVEVGRFDVGVTLDDWVFVGICVGVDVCIDTAVEVRVGSTVQVITNYGALVVLFS